MDLKKLKEETPEERRLRLSMMRKKEEELCTKLGVPMPKTEVPKKEDPLEVTISFKKH